MKSFLRHILTIALLFATVSLFSQTDEKLKKSKANTEKEIEKLNKQISKNANAKQSKLSDITLLNQRIEQRKKLISDIDIQISLTENELQKKNKSVTEIKTQLNRLKDSYSELLVNIYINRKKVTWLMYVFASEDFSQAYRRLKYLQSYADVVFIQAKKIEQTNQQLKQEISLLSDQKQELDNYKLEREQELNKLAKDEAEAEKILKSLKNEETKLKKQLQQKKTVLANLNKEIENILRREMAKDKSTGFSKAPVNVKLSADFAANRGNLPWPVTHGKIIGFFGKHSHPIFKHIELPSSKGIDIAAPDSENVLAIFDGVVAVVTPISGMNMSVLLKHGNYYTLYCRLGIVNVKVGDTVKTGTMLGKVASARNDDGSQLHFELWKEQTSLDPQLWLAKK
jgi:septal ring factor EnvC (AmiA/AmiB activator)